jgi:hypothetical protein
MSDGHAITLAFAPLDYVTVTLFDLKYHGRVNQCLVKATEFLYEVEYADDKGDLQIRCFRYDELVRR